MAAPYSQSNREQTNVNTSAAWFSNKDGSMPSRMAVGYWNSNLSIKLNPALPESARVEGGPVFDENKIVQSALTVEKISVILKELTDTIIPAFEKGEDVFKGVPVGDASLVGVGVTHINEAPTAYFAVFKDLDETIKIPQAHMRYEFKNSYTVDDFKPDTGSFSVTKNIPSELYAFVELLRGALIGLSNSTVHADRNVNKMYRDKLTNRIEDVAVKVGLPEQRQRQGGGGNYRSNGNVFDGGGRGAANGSDIPARNITGSDADSRTVENFEEMSSYL